MQRNKTLMLKGLRTPRPVLFVRGFVNGRMKTADLDQENSRLSSAYVSGMTCLFNEYCQKRVAKLETDLSAVRMEAETLLLELQALPEAEAAEVQAPGLPDKLPETVAEAQHLRSAAKASAQAAELSSRVLEKQEAAAARRAAILGRLSEIKSRIAAKEQVCCQELGAASEALRARFCTYAHGVLMRPIRTRYIPDLEYARYLDSYYAAHNTLKREIATALKPQEEEEK